MFNFIKQYRLKSEISSFAKLVLISKGGFSDKEAMKLSSEAMLIAWGSYYQLLSGVIYKKPNVFSCSLLIISTAINISKDKKEILRLSACFNYLIDELNTNNMLFDFNEVDDRIIEKSMLAYANLNDKLKEIESIEQRAVDEAISVKKRRENNQSNVPVNWGSYSHMFNGKLGYSKIYNGCEICGYDTGQKIGDYFICTNCKAKYESNRSRI
ncbi:hypothetical protein GWZ55_14865 [Vibrio cholerae]|uniref:hypothetical protein n=1 Tax=Vibrio cholerae TaxID=666 RepID=UPI00028CC861|nr:hypothetical protein [Vibrio cholerae]EGR4407594.1 hypothetical protein [Vibrio cholerae]EKL01971.1 hypothetical protein VCCP1035_3763 [Vibrio cholerae CP1035(8)]ELH8889883.1 hypothetical protein [Vibrio cholerae]NOF75088.1 hypothetical protein [Vibrio cholerae]HCJ6874376.1 hypothetical protein [Vibrio cholerae]